MKFASPRVQSNLLAVGTTLVLAAVLPAPAANAGQPASKAFSVYVSPTGNDQNPGTETRPFRTLERARDWARSRNQNQTGDLTIYLGGGTYRLSQPLRLTARDSGTGGHHVIYAALPGEQPMLCGGLRVTGWKLVDADKNLWSAPAPAGLTNTRQFYVNGVRAERTRGRLPVKLSQTRRGYIADSPVMASWRNPSAIEFVYTGGNSLWSEHSEGLGPWTEPRCPVASIKGKVITMAQPCWNNSTKRIMLPASSGFHRAANLVGPANVGHRPEYVENAYELLGTPGQWYFDRSARTLYYVPRPGEDLTKANVEVPVLQTLISGRGTANHPIHNLIFKGIQFSYATWLFPSGNEGFSEIQANYMVTGPDGYATQGLCDLAPNGQCPFGDWTKTPGNISFSYDRSIQFLNNDFVHLGAAGLELGDGSQADTVEGCVFTDISGNGLDVGGVDLPESSGGQVTRDNRILDNHIYNIAAEYHGGVGICVGYAQRTLIAHNQLDHLPYTAISMGWGGWPDKIHRAGVANNSRNNHIENNLIFDHLQLLADGGGIYTQGLTGPSLAEGEKIIGNVIYNQLGSGHGLYTDNSCNNVTAKSNVIFQINFDDWGSHHHDYYDGHHGKIYDAFVFEDNYWQQGNRDSSKENVTLKDNHLISTLNEAPKAILRNAGLQPAFKGILNQRFGRASAPEPPHRVAAAAGNGFAYVSWNPSVFDGGAPIKSYTVISSQGNKVNISAAGLLTKGYLKVTGLTNGRSYTFRVEASNANGSSAPSLPSAAVVPHAKTIHRPSVPSRAYAEPGDGMASVHFRGPRHDGGSPIIAYVITSEPGGHNITLTGRSVLTLGSRHTTFGVVTGLKNGISYRFKVAAINADGEGVTILTRSVTPRAADPSGQ